ncbi:MAG: hypothetical protein AAGI01_03535 [Myxococcota bacterium]
MPEVKIRMVSNPKTGKRDIFIDYEADDDALPMEHESDHKDIVEQLLGEGILQPDDVGNVTWTRVRPEPAQREAITEEPEKDAQAEGN